MARAPIAMVVLATAVVGCGYQPAPDHRSDPLSARDNVEVAKQIDALALGCSSAPDPSGLADDEIARYVERYIDAPERSRRSLSAVAREQPHAVFRTTTNHQDEFNDETMIQVLERLAHSNSNCDDAKPLGDVAERLRSPR